MSHGKTIRFYLLVLLLGAAPSHASVLVSNLGEPPIAEFNTSNFVIGGSFSTAGGSYTLHSVTVSVFSNSSGTSELRLRADDAGLPGELIESLGAVTIGMGSSQVTYDSLGTTLDADTTYWITLGENGSGDFQWDVTISTAELSPVSWTIGDQTVSSDDGGATWSPVFFGPPNESPKFAINTVVVPEPPSLGLIGLGNLLAFRAVASAKKKASPRRAQ
jgi:hypothetical protein